MTYKFSTIKSGSTGTDVIVLQTILRTLHFVGKNGKELDIDGDFGTNTEYAVKNFQRFSGYFNSGSRLPVSGIVDGKMWKVIIGA